MAPRINLYPLEQIREKIAKIMPQRTSEAIHYHQQFICEHCGQQQTVIAEDCLLDHDKCINCQNECEIARHGCNFMLTVRFT
jgi:hypothetical protein